MAVVDDFKDTLASWVSGVAVVATRLDGLVYGLTVSSFASVSLKPPLILVCLASENLLPEMIDAAGEFSVSLLAADQVAVSNSFAKPGREPTAAFDGVQADVTATGLPIVADAAGYLSCGLHSSIVQGDHTIVVGRVLEAAARNDRPPLLYCRRGYRELAGVPGPR